MKTAKELFEELGYRYVEFSNKIAYDYLHAGLNEYRDIVFDKGTKMITLESGFRDEDYSLELDFNITVEELQAINKQVEELRWNNE